MRYFIYLIISVTVWLPYAYATDDKNSVDKTELIQLISVKNNYAGWERRRKKELMDEGHSLKEIVKLIESEKSKKVDQDEESLETKVSSYFDKIHINDVTAATKITTPILEKIAKTSSSKKLENLNSEFTQQAFKIISTYPNHKKYEKEVYEIVAEQWVKWIFLSGEQKNTTLKELISSATKNILRIREERKQREILQKKYSYVKATVNSILNKFKVTEKDHSYIFDIEFDIQMKINELSGDVKEKRYEELHIIEATNFIKENNLGDTSLAMHWKDFFYHGRSLRITKYSNLVQKMFDEKLEKIMKTHAAVMTTNGLEGKEFKELYDLEMAIQRQVLNAPKKNRERDEQTLHIIEADNFVRNSPVLDIYSGKTDNERYLKEISAKWKDWFYQGSLMRHIMVKKIRDQSEFNIFTEEIANKSAKIKSDDISKTIKEMDKNVKKLIGEYYDNEAASFKILYRKLPPIFDLEIKKYTKSGDVKTVKNLMAEKDKFIKTGLSPNTISKEIKRINDAHLKKVTNKYSDVFCPKYKAISNYSAS